MLPAFLPTFLTLLTRRVRSVPTIQEVNCAPHYLTLLTLTVCAASLMSIRSCGR